MLTIAEKVKDTVNLANRYGNLDTVSESYKLLLEIKQTLDLDGTHVYYDDDDSVKSAINADLVSMKLEDSILESKKKKYKNVGIIGHVPDKFMLMEALSRKESKFEMTSIADK